MVAYDAIWSTINIGGTCSSTIFNINFTDCTLINEHTKAEKYDDSSAYEPAVKVDAGGTYTINITFEGGYIESEGYENVETSNGCE